MKEPDLSELKGKIEVSLRNILNEKLIEIRKQPEMLHEMLTLKVAVIFSTNIKASYSEIRSDLDSLNQDFLSELDFRVVVDEVVSKVLREFDIKPFPFSAIEMIATRYGCSPSEAKDHFFRELRIKKLGVKGANELIIGFQDLINQEAEDFNSSKDLTPSFLLTTWTREYINSGLYKDRIRTKEDVYNDFFEVHPDLRVVFEGGGNWTKLISPELAQEILEESKNSDDPASRYYTLALSKRIYEKDFTEAIKLLDKGLSLDPKAAEHYYLSRAVCYSKLLLLNEAVQDLEKAKSLILSLIDLNDPDNFFVNQLREIDEDIMSLKSKGYMKSTSR